MSVLGRLVGTPQSTAASDPGEEVVKAKEFDITQYAKKLSVATGLIAAAVLAALEVFDVEEVTEAIVIAGLAVIAVCLFSASLVMAVDMIARAIVTRSGGNGDEGGSADGAGALGTVQAGVEVQIEGSTENRPVLAIRSQDGAGDSLLVPTGVRAGNGNPPTFEGPLRWIDADRVKAARASQD